VFCLILDGDNYCLAYSVNYSRLLSHASMHDFVAWLWLVRLSLTEFLIDSIGFFLLCVCLILIGRVCSGLELILMLGTSWPTGDTSQPNGRLLLLRSPSQPQGISILRPVPYYTAW